jgi:glycosyltransferase involved in cell wall biosynthesis
MTGSKKADVSIAIIIPGGIGTGKYSNGVPILERIVKLLAQDYAVTVFQLFRTNEGYHPEGFRLVSISSRSRIIRGLKFLWIFWKHNKGVKFKIVHGFWINPSGFLAVLTGKIFRIRSVVSIQGGDAIALPSIHYGQLRNPISKAIIGWTLSHADVVTALTKYLVDNLAKEKLYIKNIKIVPFGVDTDVFRFQEKQISRPVKMLNIGNLYPVKDQVTLLRTFKIISEKIPCELTIIGEGVLEAQLRRWIVKLDLVGKASIVRPVPYERLSEFYREAGIMVHTSMSEGQGVVIAEAMSSGLLVCGTRVGLLYDLPECCVAVTVGDHEQLAREVLLHLDNPALISDKIKKSITWARTHSLLWTVNAFKEIYHC